MELGEQESAEDTKRRPFERYRERTIYSASFGVLATTLGLIINPLDPQSEWWQVYVTVCSAIFSIAIVSLVYDFFLRRSFAQSLLRFVRISGAVESSGLQVISEANDVEWREFFKRSGRFVFVLSDHWQAWLYFHHVLGASKGRQVSIRFCLPDPASAESPDRGGEKSNAAMEAGLRLKEVFEQNQTKLGAGSELEVAHFQERLAFGGVVLDNSTALLLSDADGRERGQEPVTFVFVNSDSTLIRQLRQSLKAVSKSATLVEKTRIAPAGSKHSPEEEYEK